MNGENRADVKIGARVSIVLKAGKRTEGVVARLLPDCENHVIYAEHFNMPNNISNFWLFPVREGERRRKQAAAERKHGAARIYTPGEIEWEHYTKAEREGLFLPDDVGIDICWNTL